MKLTLVYSVISERKRKDKIYNPEKVINDDCFVTFIYYVCTLIKSIDILTRFHNIIYLYKLTFRTIFSSILTMYLFKVEPRAEIILMPKRLSL